MSEPAAETVVTEATPTTAAAPDTTPADDSLPTPSPTEDSTQPPLAVAAADSSLDLPSDPLADDVASASSDLPSPLPSASPDASDDADPADADADDDTDPPLISPRSPSAEPDVDLPVPSSSPPSPSPSALPPAPLDAADAELARYDVLVREAGAQQQTLTMALDALSDDDLPDPSDPFDPSNHSGPPLPRPGLLASPTAAAALSALTAASPALLPAATIPSARRTSFSLPDDDALSPSAPSSSALDAARAECDALLAVNRQRQRTIASFLEAQQRHSSHHGAPSNPPPSDDAPPAIKTDYIKLLTQIHGLWDELAAQQAQGEAQVAGLIAALNAQDAKGEALAASLRGFQVEIARTAVDRHGSPLSLKALERLHAEDAALAKALADVRLQYLTQQAKVDCVQAAIREKEELAEGLHLIDFEQLKIENATLHEKVEERQDEIYKLRKKKNTAVEVLTHVREKVWWVWEENEGLRGQVAEEEAAIQEKRAEMKALKAQREALRRDNEGLKVKEGFVGLDALVLDYERGRERLRLLQADVAQRQAQYRALKGTAATRPQPRRQEEQKEQLNAGTGRRTPTLTVRR